MCKLLRNAYGKEDLGTTLLTIIFSIIALVILVAFLWGLGLGAPIRLVLPIPVGLGIWWVKGKTGSVGVQAGVATTTITRLARSAEDPKAAAALSLDLASKIVTVLDCGIEDLLEVVEV
jgi:hypothetical protein